MFKNNSHNFFIVHAFPTPADRGRSKETYQLNMGDLCSVKLKLPLKDHIGHPWTHFRTRPAWWLCFEPNSAYNRHSLLPVQALRFLKCLRSKDYVWRVSPRTSKTISAKLWNSLYVSAQFAYGKADSCFWFLFENLLNCNLFPWNCLWLPSKPFWRPTFLKMFVLPSRFWLLFGLSLSLLKL